MIYILEQFKRYRQNIVLKPPPSLPVWGPLYTKFLPTTLKTYKRLTGCLYFKGTVSWDFLNAFFFTKQLLLVPVEISYGHFDVLCFLLSYFHLKMTHECPKHSRVSTQRCHKHRRVLTPSSFIPKCFFESGNLWLSTVASTVEFRFGSVASTAESLTKANNSDKKQKQSKRPQGIFYMIGGVVQ